MQRFNLRNLTGRWLNGSDPDELDADYTGEDKHPVRSHGHHGGYESPERRPKLDHRPKRPSKQPVLNND